MAAGVNAVELIKDRLDIVNALSIYAGADFGRISLNREKVSIRCPFHQDNSPSMTVYLRDHRFRCWSGCNDGRPGDVIDVLKITFNLSTAEAIKKLREDLAIDSSHLAPDTVARITENRRAMERRRLDHETMDWASNSLQWLYREIPRQSATIKTDKELEVWSALIYLHAEIEYKMDCLLGLEFAEDWEKAEITEWTKALMEGVKELAAVG